MNVRRRILSATCAALAATFAWPPPPGRPRMSIEIPNGAEINKPVNVTYAGVADAAGHDGDHRDRPEHAAADVLLKGDGACSADVGGAARRGRAPSSTATRSSRAPRRSASRRRSSSSRPATTGSAPTSRSA